MAQVVDYSFARPSPLAISGAGYVGAIRYLSGGADFRKELTATERDDLHAAGLAIGLVWETTASRASAGSGAGTIDARKANAQADALGWPDDRPIYYAVDFGTVWPNVAPYFEAAEAESKRPVGVYGCYDVIEGAAAAGFRWLWQCAAWSGNGSGTGGSAQGRRLSAHANLFQRVGYVLDNSSDVNDVLTDDWGGYHPDPGISGADMPLNDADKAWIKQAIADATTPIWQQLTPRGGAPIRDVVEATYNAAAAAAAKATGTTGPSADAIVDEFARRLNEGGGP